MPSPLIQSVTPRGLLSFGPETEQLSLGMLNVLIGPNASGKSNLLDIFRLARSLPTDLQQTLRGAGGVRSWLRDDGDGQHPELEVTINQSEVVLRHRLKFRSFGAGLWPIEEEIEHVPGTLIYESRYDEHHAQIRVRDVKSGESTRGEFGRLLPPLRMPMPRQRIAEMAKTRDGEVVETDYPAHNDQSILEQRQSPSDYPELSLLASAYRQIRMFDTWQFGRTSSLRRSQPADNRGDRLEEDYSNLAIVLNQLGAHPDAKQNVIDGMQDLYDGFTSYEVVVNSGSAQIYFTEHGHRSIPATRISDGTLRYLSILAMLYTPATMPLLCLEEPELGLHPDMIPVLCNHLVAASRAKQLIVTTHSDILIDALTHMPEAVIVFENAEGATDMKRLEQGQLNVWLDKYRLGELWTSGEIGGTRW